MRGSWISESQRTGEEQALDQLKAQNEFMRAYAQSANRFFSLLCQVLVYLGYIAWFLLWPHLVNGTTKGYVYIEGSDHVTAMGMFVGTRRFVGGPQAILTATMEVGLMVYSAILYGFLIRAIRMDTRSIEADPEAKARAGRLVHGVAVGMLPLGLLMLGWELYLIISIELQDAMQYPSPFSMALKTTRLVMVLTTYPWLRKLLWYNDDERLKEADEKVRQKEAQINYAESVDNFSVYSR